MAPTALVFGVIIAVEGIIGLADPGGFAAMAYRVHTPPAIHFVAATRVLIGIIISGTSALSRVPRLMIGVGSFIALEGLLTPHFGRPFADMLGNWMAAETPEFVQLWAGGILLLGAAVIYAFIGVGYRMPRRDL